MVDGLIVPTFYERVSNAANRAYCAWRLHPSRETWAALSRAICVRKRRYGDPERAQRLLTRTERTQLYKAT